MKHNVKEIWLVMTLAIVGVFAFSSCSAEKQIQYVEVLKEVHDTTKVFTHDTTLVNNYIHDSVDRFVKDSSWMDSLGHYYHERYVSLTKYINVQSEEYKALQQLYENTLLQMNDSTKVEYKTVEVEKKVYVWWPLFVVFGLIAGIFGYIYIKKKTTKGVGNG